MPSRKIAFYIALFGLAMAPRQYRACAQQPTSSLAITAAYSPTSSHILIGISEKRRIATGGIEYTRQLWRAHRSFLDYRVEADPFFRESDPTMVAEQFTIAGITSLMPIAPVRVVRETNTPVGTVCPPCAALYPVYGRDEVTYGGGASPLGIRTGRLVGSKLAITFEGDAGFIVGTRAIPVDGAEKWNYSFGFGPGLQLRFRGLSAIRVEYAFRHISNADTGTINPGVDQGVFRVSLAHYGWLKNR